MKTVQLFSVESTNIFNYICSLIDSIRISTKNYFENFNLLQTIMKGISFYLLYVVFIIPVYSQVSHADNSQIRFWHISLREGLSHSTVYDITQDKLGYMWFATADGLSRYDSYEFVVFRHNPNDSLSIPSNYTTSFLWDENGDLWIGTGAGLVKYNYQQQSFTNFSYRDNGSTMCVFRMEKWSENIFIVATNLGLFSFSEKDGFRILNFPSMSFEKTAILKVSDKLLIGANTGLYFYDPQTDTYSLINEQFKDKNVMTMLPQDEEKHKIWIGTEGSGLYLFDLVNNQLKQYYHDKNDPKSISSNFVRALCYDDSRRLWIGTLMGLNILNEDNQDFTRFYNSINDNGTISNNSIRSIFLDFQHGLWIGTFYGGLNYYHPRKKQFEHIYYVNGSNSLNYNGIGCMLADPDNKIWMGANDIGLDVYNTKTKKFEHFQNNWNVPYLLGGNFVKTIMKVDDTNLLVGAHGGGLEYFDIRSRRFTRVFLSDDPMSDENVYGLAKDSTGMVWVGTLNGLIRYNPKTKESIPFENLAPNSKKMNQKIMGLFIDSKQRLWIGTNNGVWLYHQHNLQQINFTGKAESEKTVYGFFEHSSGQIWVGTSEGLYYLKENELIGYKKDDGFPSFHICSIQEDHFGQLWVSTYRGLICLSPDSGKWWIYTESDGLQSNQFNDYASCKTADGKMFFGGINGITVFSPDRLVDNPYSPAPIIENLSVFNETITPNDNTGILSQIIELTNAIKLKPQYNNFALEFVVPNFLSGKKNSFAYLLEGFDKDWYITEKNSVSYSNLVPGKYTFRLKSANNNGKWSSEETKLQIEILPYWYNTWWAKTLFILMISTLIFYLIRFFFSRKLIAHELELERKDKKRVKELDEMKIRFFVNISHEFRTPLTLILSPVRELLSKGIKEPWIRKQLTIVERNAERMLYLINQTLDYRKSELGNMPLQIRLAEVEVFCRRCFDLFAATAQCKGFNYIFNSTIGDAKLYYDRNFLERILSNLLSNAFKYTPHGGTIELFLYLKDKHLYVEVIDTGIGIPEDKFENVFIRFYQQEENTQGTGIGLSLVKNLVDIHHGRITLESELGKGSKFTVILPAAKEFYTQSEMHSDVEVINPAEYPVKFENDILSRNQHVIVAEEEQGGEQGIEDEDRIDEQQQILLVEDDEEIRNYLFEQLSEKYKVVTACNGEKAWKILHETKINLILSDLMMPVLDGVSLCKMAKQNINFSHIPFILLTAKTDIQDQLKGLQTGADDYIGKPFVYSILEKKIENIFRQHSRIIAKYASSPELHPSELVGNPLDEEFLNKAVAVVEKYLNDCEFSVEKFSQEMCMSRSNLHLKIKAITGESASDFIRKVRLSSACKLLKNNLYNVTEISTMIGMSPTYFSTSFRKYIGCSPSEYLKNQTIKQD